MFTMIVGAREMKNLRVLAAVVFLLAALLPFGSVARAEGDIVDIAIEDGRFTTLVAAVDAADLVDALKGEGPLTVFAPTDDAFNKLPEGTVPALLENTALLTDILLYHVVSGKVMAADVVNLSSAETLLGETISISVQDGRVFLNDEVEVIITDIEASNGVIHVIDTVLLPSAAQAAPAQTNLPEAGVAPEAGNALISLLPVGIAVLGAAGYYAQRKLRG
jgi:uncharacterized surface protein with fasciclin (FAS1) repeats